MDDTLAQAPTALLTITDAATLLNVSKATIRRWTNEGRLSCSRIGARGERRFHKADLLAFIQQPGASAPSPAQPARMTPSPHCCIISNDVEEEWATLGPEILRGLRQGTQVLVIEDADRQQFLEDLLAANGLNKHELMVSHALRCVSIEDSYLLSGSMQWERVVAFVESAILAAKASGFDRILVIGASSWAKNFAGQDVVGELRKYELGLDEMLSRYPGASVLCPYAATQVTSHMMVQAFAAHPAIRIQSATIPGLLDQSARQ
jgi:excisionase family DNA binding protein